MEELEDLQFLRFFKISLVFKEFHRISSDFFDFHRFQGADVRSILPPVAACGGELRLRPRPPNHWFAYFKLYCNFLKDFIDFHWISMHFHDFIDFRGRMPAAFCSLWRRAAAPPRTPQSLLCLLQAVRILGFQGFHGFQGLEGFADFQFSRLFGDFMDFHRLSMDFHWFS